MNCYSVITVECLKDNLSYLLLNHGNSTAIAIDPGEAAPFFRALEKVRQESGVEFKLAAAILTHHHHDHVDGLREFPRLPTWSSNRDQKRIVAASGSGACLGLVPGRSYSWRELADGHVTLQPDCREINDVSDFHDTEYKPEYKAETRPEILFDIIEIPGHTQGQIAIRLQGIAAISQRFESHLFVGDTLFSFGCGRCLEGTTDQLYSSLQIIKAFSGDTILHFGHEYTLRNIGFWKMVAEQEPRRCEGIVDLEALNRLELELIDQVKGRRPAPQLATELELNPFLRVKTSLEFAHWRNLRNLF